MKKVMVDYELVKTTMEGTKASIDKMQESIDKLLLAIDGASSWQGKEAIDCKMELLNYVDKLDNCANYMEAAARHSIEHAALLKQVSTNNNTQKAE